VVASRQLILLRHAQAEPAAPQQADAERPLSARGTMEAARAAQSLHACIPQVILTSPAARARTTAAVVAAALGLGPEQLRAEPALYLATPATLLELIRHLKPALRTVMICGHNPGLSELASEFARSAIELPTASVCTVSLGAARWSACLARPRTVTLCP
jgi:phosphohistidine phosphatase